MPHVLEEAGLEEEDERTKDSFSRRRDSREREEREHEIKQFRAWYNAEGVPRFLPVQSAVRAKAGRLTVFLSESAHSVTPMRRGVREAFFQWFSCEESWMRKGVYTG
jgi:hypothetical protein